MAVDVGAATALHDSTPRTSPHAWRTVRFDQMAQNIADRVDNPSEAGVDRYVGLEHLDPESLKIRRWGHPSDVAATKLRFKPGDIIFGRRRAYQRKLAVADFEGICSAHAMVLRAREDTVLKGFLPFFMQSDLFFNRALQISVGSLSPTINWSALSRQEFTIPPLDEQRRIADILLAADDVIVRYTAAQDALAACTAAYLNDYFPSTITNASGNPIRIERLGNILSHASDGPFGSKLKTEHYTATGARVIRLQNIGEGEFLDDDQAYISDSYYQDLVRYSLHAGDILVAGLGDETHPVGRVCQVPEWLGPAINKADCFCLRVDTSIVEAEYILYFLNSPYARQQVGQVSQGTTRLRVNVSNLKSILVPIPTRTRQLTIGEALHALDNRVRQLRDFIVREQALARMLRESLLNGNEFIGV